MTVYDSTPWKGGCRWRTKSDDECADEDPGSHSGRERCQMMPRHFCWTRFGTEAGESIEKILERKDTERRRNGGLFLWGIGNAISPSMRELVRLEGAPEVIFSPIRSAPRPADVRPASVLMWTAALDLDGKPWALPQWSLVTSRALEGPRQQRHYALVCFSEAPLEVSPSPSTFPVGNLENILSSSKVGASQVTAIVRHRPELPANGVSYCASIRTRLVAPYLVQLCDPEPALHLPRSAARIPAVDTSRGGLPSLFPHAS